MVGNAIYYDRDSPRRMRINEVFKIPDRRLRTVDYIGMMEKELPPLTFTKRSPEARGKSQWPISSILLLRGVVLRRRGSV
jgi:hypothetical protein